MPKIQSYDKYLVESLKNSNEAYLYLAAAFEDNDPHIAAIALDYVLKAQNYSVKQISEQAHVSNNTPNFS